MQLPDFLNSTVMDFDIIVIGGGLVGASLVAALRQTDLQIALVENGPGLLPVSAGWDSRIYAISPGNAEFLHESGTWQLLDLDRVQQVTAMRVFGDTGAELDFSSFEIGAPELNFILENRLLHNALWQRLQQQDNLTLYTQTRCASLDWQPQQAALTLADGRVLRAKLIVGADGRESWVRQQAGISASPNAYQQDGLVANFAIEKPHHGTAFQWFQQDGILALLPLPDKKVSMVWSVSPEKSAELRKLAPADLCSMVEAASQHILGKLELVTPPAAFPLRLLRLPQIVAPRLALIGDAAHNVHPLAGQGVNLGFRDAKNLSRIINEYSALHDCGDLRLLRRYERSRQEDIISMQLTTDALKHLFNNTDPLLRNLRNLGLSITNRITPLKKLLAQHALN